MTFADLVAALSKELGMEIEIENDACAVRTGAADGASVTILLQGFDDRGTVLATADLGEPPPERLERLFRSLLEANDLFRDTGGATLSLDPSTGHVRLQRFDAFDALAEVGPAKAFVAFADFAATWAEIIRDFRDVPEDADGKGETPSPPASGIFA
jgi:hypothetical protein